MLLKSSSGNKPSKREKTSKPRLPRHLSPKNIKFFKTFPAESSKSVIFQTLLLFKFNKFLGIRLIPMFIQILAFKWPSFNSQKFSGLNISPKNYTINSSFLLKKYFLEQKIQAVIQRSNKLVVMRSPCFACSSVFAALSVNILTVGVKYVKHVELIAFFFQNE